MTHVPGLVVLLPRYHTRSLLNVPMIQHFPMLLLYSIYFAEYYERVQPYRTQQPFWDWPLPIRYDIHTYR